MGFCGEPRRALRARIATGGLRAVAAVCLATLAGGAPAAHAQTGPSSGPVTLGLPSKDTLRARQEALFQRLIRDPNNPELMLSYARVSVQAENHEGAILTLERLLMFVPESAAVRLELGALYFAVGSYPVAEHYLREALAKGGLDSGGEARANTFLDEIAKRQQKSRFSGDLSIGAIATSNGTFGSRDPVLVAPNFSSVGGVIPTRAAANIFLTGKPQREAGGVRARAKLAHRYDLGGPQEAAWRTDFHFDGRALFDPESFDFASTALRTGPRFTVFPEIPAIRVKPFFESRSFFVDDELTFWSAGGGVEVDYTFSDRWGVFAEAVAQHREFDLDDADGLQTRGAVGFRVAPSRDLRMRTAVRFERESAAENPFASTAAGLTFDLDADYQPPIAGMSEKWRLSGFVHSFWRHYDSPPFGFEGAGDRYHFDFAVGLANRFQLDRNWAILTEVDYRNRVAPENAYEFDAVTGGVSVSYRF